MKKTFCDRDGKQCVNTTVIVSVRTIHHTADFQYVGSDEYKDIELCVECAALLRSFMPAAFVIQIANEHEEDMAMAEAPIRVAASPDQIARERIQ